MDQHDRPARTEPTLANEHAESSEATEPTEPTDKIDPADPTDRIDPVEPMDKMDPLEPMLRIDPAEPASRRERSSFRMKLFSQPAEASRRHHRSRSPTRREQSNDRLASADESDLSVLDA
jgi:hypothetical protein